MSDPKPQKIVYLLGAGATHAEIVNLDPEKSIDRAFLDKNGLLIKHVSERVIRKAKEAGVLESAQIKKLVSPAGLSNIELFISLVDKNQIKSEEIIEKLKEEIKKDIRERLKRKTKKFYLHKALLEFHVHKKVRGEEELLGFISLNYDDVLDGAYNDLSVTPDYGLYSQSESEIKKIPLLKLHGGFNLSYKNRVLPIITPGVNKNYLELPFNFIWGRALEILVECNQLRVIGCSLSQNDIGLIDLLFKAYLAKEGKPFEIQMITFDRDFNLGDGTSSNEMKKSYGFFPNIKTALELENRLITDENIKDPSTGANPFKIWLKAKVGKIKTEKILTDQQINKTRYIKKLLV